MFPSCSCLSAWSWDAAGLWPSGHERFPGHLQFIPGPRSREALIPQRAANMTRPLERSRTVLFYQFSATLCVLGLLGSRASDVPNLRRGEFRGEDQAEPKETRCFRVKRRTCSPPSWIWHRSCQVFAGGPEVAQCPQMFSAPRCANEHSPVVGCWWSGWFVTKRWQTDRHSSFRSWPGTSRHILAVCPRMALAWMLPAQLGQVASDVTTVIGDISCVPLANACQLC